MPHRDPTRRSTHRWAIALDGLDSLSTDDDYSSSEISDSETTYLTSDVDSDSDTDDSDSDDYSDDDTEHGASQSPQLVRNRWQGTAINAHEWTFPRNAILPNLQDVFREAATNRDIDINQRIKALTMSSSMAINSP